jgi:hypothetical protein
VTGTRSYGNPSSFRQALTEKLRGLATTSRWNLQQLQRQMAYDRFLERLYLVNASWIVKGATALLARNIGVRATIDIDVYLPAVREVAEAELRQAVETDIGDWFRFEIGGPRPVADTGGVRLPVTAFVGNARWAAFHVDLVGANLRMTGEPENVPPLAARRGLRLPERLVVPDRARWEAGYAAEARRSLLRSARTLDEALAEVGPFADALLDGSALGTWHQHHRRWGE